MMRIRLQLAGLAAAVLLSPGELPAQTKEFTNTAEIVLATVNPAMLGCLEHCTIGICFWLNPRTIPPRIETSLQVRHNWPDVVATSYENPGEQPWFEMSGISAAAALTAQGYGLLSGTTVGGGRHTPANNSLTKHGADRRREQLNFREVDIFGHPLASGNRVLGGFGRAIPGLCPSNAVSFVPYYLSGLDVLSWRNPEVELLYPQSWIPFVYEVGTVPIDIWGGVYPRNGFLGGQADPFRVHGVMVSRGADIVYSSTAPHVYRRISGNFNARGAKWQKLTPYPSHRCVPFGYQSDPLGIRAPPVAQNDAAAFSLWQRYQCCLPKPGQIFLRSVTTPTICILDLIP